MNFFEENSIQLIVFCMTLVKEENSKGMMEQKKNKWDHEQTMKHINWKEQQK